MATMYCALCGRPVEARRHLGPVTILFAVMTAGFSLLAVPFYPKRCSICKTTAVSDTAPGGAKVSSSPAPYARIAELEQRLVHMESELESSNTELDRLRTERDFYRQLLEDPGRRRSGSHAGPGPGDPINQNQLTQGHTDAEGR